ncbi:cell surface receptor IPT/TIG domain-containing protein [Heterostelium album PN500]|uniref:Cell surface receptor IPT/TIG domain-containing protein n=1 Tax=Heterostelium pallidum (strain ATCC 26659 / Pp 5 / PN500) TaxID=670386 RepID=D3BIB7_HETP5|nr:cell surface receptor IPT/TIG domain-containing protein [Heterostelium album PN500]EFA79017.1 cell surface receptor IPT/TIG domain-containing protein [Heterostelium album PN500]|eukprot:XP_020431140.1 cell surface receptor IPT/TIG domain-containing protein [Heterostelium album PN500]
MLVGGCDGHRMDISSMTCWRITIIWNKWLNNKWKMVLVYLDYSMRVQYVQRLNLLIQQALSIGILLEILQKYLVSVVYAIEIDSHSKLKAYDGGNFIFKVVGRNFPNIPILSITVGNESTCCFCLQWKLWRYLQLGSTSAIFNLHFDVNAAPYFSGAFEYVEPIINDFSPQSYYPNANGRTLRLQGDYFIINDDDPHPTAQMIRHDGAVHALTINSVGPNRIQCVIPDISPADIGGYVIKVRTYTGLEVIGPSNFDYVFPVVRSVTPDRGIAGQTHVIVLNGDNFHDIFGFSFSTITVGGQPCTNPQVDKLTGAISCTTPNVALAPSQADQQDITLTIDVQQAHCDRKFLFYSNFLKAPEILTINPKRGFAAGGTNVVVQGHYLMDVTAANIGGSICTIDVTTITADTFTCRASAFDLNDITGVTHSLVATIGGGQYSSPPTEQFTYYTPNIVSISPAKIIDKANWVVTITGTGFFANNLVKIADQVFVPTGASTDKILYVDVDASRLSVGNVNLIVNSDGGDSNTVQIAVAKPEISAITPANGYVFSETAVTLTIKDFPLGMTQDDIDKYFVVKIKDKLCERLEQVGATRMTCMVQPGDAVQAEDLSFSIKTIAYTSTVKFTYFEPTVTAQAQSTNIPKGGGNLVIDGTNLDLVSTVKLDTEIMDITTCVIQVAQITCTIPAHIPGAFPIVLVVVDTNDVEHEYNTGTNINYVGPSITKVSPKYGSKKHAATITLEGTGFGNTAGLITVTVGANACNNVVVVTNNIEITCDIAALAPAVYPVEIQVQPNALTAAVDSMDQITYTSNTLSCLAPGGADGSSAAVDWWFVYKLSSGASNPYLYIDSTMDRLERRINLQQHPTPNTYTSPIEATFLQHPDYYYMFFNDQPDSRTKAGKRSKSKRKTSNGAHGHLKGMIFWDDPAPVTGHISGIHIEHSNPAFPSYQAASGTALNGPDKGIKFLGAKDFNQYFFCYSFNQLEHVFRYISFNDGNPLDKHRVFANMNTWTPIQMNQYPYFYDYLSQHLGYSDRVPSLGTPDKKKPSELMADCKAVIAGTVALENVCWWRTGQIAVANGNLNAYYFMKIGTDFTRKTSPFGNANLPRPPTLSKYILKKQQSRVYDGIDLWMVVADHFQRKMFIEMFYAIAAKQMEPTEQVLNVAFLELPQLLATRKPKGGGGFKYYDYQYTGRKNEHAKFGLPMYPAYGANANNANENYFCVGDSNRHNGQGGRGGGVICIQHPTLVYQFHRMIRHYNTLNAAGQLTSPSDRDAIEFSFAINQPIKLDRPATWTNPINIEIKDYIANVHYSKLPKEVYQVLPATILAAHDVLAEFQALRTTRTNVAPAGGEMTSVTPPATFPVTQPDIMNFFATDIMTLHYQAFDQAIGSVCDYDALKVACLQADTRVTEIDRTLPFGYAAPDYPAAYGYTYAGLQPARTYNLNTNKDFILLKFVSEFMTKLPNPKRKNYQFMIDTTGTILTTRFQPPFIIRLTVDMCQEEIAYFMTLQYIYYQAGAQNEATLLYNINAISPNWANGVILAISKKLYNSLVVGKNANFDPCFDNIFDNFPNIETYTDDKAMDPPGLTLEKIVRRSAAAAWDWMGPSYADGNGARVNRVDNADVIPVDYLMKLMIKTFQISGVQSMDGFAKLVKKQYKTEINFKTILINNYIIKPPAPKVAVVANNGIVLMNFPMNFQSRRLQELIEDPIDSQAPLLQDERSLDSGIHQLLLSYMNTMNESSVTSLTPYEQEKLEISIDKWITIRSQSQAIQTLVLDPTNQHSNQPIKFIDEINRDQNGHQIDLGYQTIGTTGSRYTLLSPLSIVSITFVLESIMISEAASRVSIGDLEFYYLPKPANYNGVITSDVDGIGPVVTSISNSTGPTVGGNIITLNGIRFNSSMTVAVGDYECQSTTLISSNQIVCTVPKGSGTQHLIQLFTDQTLFNLQRTKFFYSYNAPAISDISPNIIESYGTDIMTIFGSNFGDDVSKVKIMIDERLECSPIIGISSDSIVCVTPSAIGDHRTVTVSVADQTSRYTIATLETQSFSFSGPQINAFAPSSGDPNDVIIVLGNGFGNPEDSDLPPLIYIDDDLVEINNFTNDEITFTLEFDTLTQPLVIQAGDQSVNSQFTYLPPVVSLFNNTFVKTSGGLIQIFGYGWGISTEEVEFTVGASDIDCNAFDYFVECYIPPGIGANLSVTATVSDQSIDLGINDTISYLPPTISKYRIGDENNLLFYGTNFVPVDLGVTFDAATTYVKLVYDNHIQTCTTFKSSSYIECAYSNQLPNTAQVFIAGQPSNILNLSLESRTTPYNTSISSSFILNLGDHIKIHHTMKYTNLLFTLFVVTLLSLNLYTKVDAQVTIPDSLETFKNAIVEGVTNSTTPKTMSKITPYFDSVNHLSGLNIEYSDGSTKLVGSAAGTQQTTLVLRAVPIVLVSVFGNSSLGISFKYADSTIPATIGTVDEISYQSSNPGQCLVDINGLNPVVFSFDDVDIRYPVPSSSPVTVPQYYYQESNGEFRYRYDIPKSNDYGVFIGPISQILIDNSVAYNFGTNEFSVTSLVQTTLPGTIITNKPASGGTNKGGWRIVINTNGVIVFTIDNGFGIYRSTSSTSQILDGNWHLVAAIRRSDGQLEIWLDAVKLTTTTTGSNLSANSLNMLYIGANYYNNITDRTTL